MVFWVVMLCSDVVGYQWFRGLCPLNLQSEDNVKMYHNDIGYEKN
jgi:hypothetical protein